jgi:small GTP-binding protein
MSSDISKVLEVFSKFLDPKVAKIGKLKTIEEIKKLSIYSYKFITKSEAKVLKDIIGISNIEEASKLNKEKPFESLNNIGSTKDPIKAAEIQDELNEKIIVLKEKYPELEDRLKKAIVISSIITRVVDEEDNFEKAAQKVIIIGLDNAGKTAILNKFGGRLGINDLANLKPTKGVDRRYIKTEDSDLDLYVWDMGGQAQYRSKYIQNPEQYFLQIDLLIYVIDVIDSNRFVESFEYFEQILKILALIEEEPFILIYIHKCDPDLKHDYLTSIFSLISTEPKFSKYIKEVMSSTDSLTNPTLKKVEGLGKTLEETMNAVIRLSESLSKQLSELDNRLRVIESGAFQMAQSGIPIGIANPGVASERPGDSRSTVLNELKQLFEKKRKLNL